MTCLLSFFQTPEEYTVRSSWTEFATDLGCCTNSRCDLGLLGCLPAIGMSVLTLHDSWIPPPPPSPGIYHVQATKKDFAKQQILRLKSCRSS